MPCIVDDHGQTERELRAELNHVTALLCGLCDVLDDSNGLKLIPLVPGLVAWRTKHQQADRERLAREAQASAASERKAAARSKLSLDERLALGLED